MGEKVIKYKKSKHVPDWVVGRDVNLDEFFTQEKFAKYCLKSFESILKKNKVNLRNYKFLEPSVGSGSFFNLLPPKKRVGVDVVKKNKEIHQHDFLTWEPPVNQKFVAIGNPPFGYRGWLAIAFLNRVSEYCDYAGFILPKGFISESRGSPKYRIPRMKLIHSEELPNNIFRNEDDNVFQVNTVWQVWKKQTKDNENIKNGKAFGAKQIRLNAGSKPTHGGWLTYKSDEYLDLYTVDLRKERLCGVKLMDKYNFFLQRSFFKEQPKLVPSFKKVNYVSGYGFIVKKNKTQIRKILNNTNWENYCTLTVHNVRHISMYHIRKALTDGGLKPSTSQKSLDGWTKKKK